MKTCRKCKKKVANNAKICKYCGADVTKAVVIKNVNNTKSAKNVNSVSKVKVNQDQKALDVSKTEIIKTSKNSQTKQEKYNARQSKQALLKNEKVRKQQEKRKKTIEDDKDAFLKNTKAISKKSLDKALKLDSKQEKEQKPRKEKQSLLKSSKEHKSDDNKVKVTENKTKKKIDETLQSSVNKDLENKEKVIAKEPKKEASSSKVNDNVDTNITVKSNKKKKFKISRFFNKYTLLLVILLLLGFTAFICGVTLFESDNSLQVSDYGKEFAMNQSIRFGVIAYNITNVSVVGETEYRKPKEGNHFVMVTIEMENYSKNKVKYSYRNWKMLNSKGEESSRVFTPVNADSALYSGYLVVGGSKTGTLVFEQPKDDSNLYLQFYQLVPKETADGVRDVVDEETGVIFKIKLNDVSEKNSSENE